MSGLGRAMRCAVYDRGGWRCCYCGEPLIVRAPVWEPRAATVDHVVPVDAGGTTTADNLVACCAECNMAKREGVRPYHTAAAAAQVRKPVDVVRGRLLAKRLYPLPGRSASDGCEVPAGVSVYNGPPDAHRFHMLYVATRAGCMQDGPGAPGGAEPLEGRDA